MSKLSTFRARGSQPEAPATPGDARGADSLEAFGTESVAAPPADGPSDRVPTSSPESQRKTRRLWLLLAVCIIVAAGAGAGYYVQKFKLFQLQAASASLTIESDPSGAEVLVGGVRQGRTPLTLSVTPGEHTFELISEGRRKPVRTVARAGASVVHHVLFAPVVAPVALKAALRVVTEPANLRVFVDDVARGVSPLTISDIEPGVHKVFVIGKAGTFQRQVAVVAGETASVLITAKTAAVPRVSPSVGWLTVSSPVPLQVMEGRDIIGTSQSPRIMLPAGKHALELTNQSLGFSQKRTIQLAAQGTASIRVELPSAPLSINALPWAEAWLDGKSLGVTPIGNHLTRLGTHEVLLRHPEFGERRETVTVTLVSPARLSVDMRKPKS